MGGFQTKQRPWGGDHGALGPSNHTPEVAANVTDTERLPGMWGSKDIAEVGHLRPEPPGDNLTSHKAVGTGREAEEGQQGCDLRVHHSRGGAASVGSTSGV